MPGSGSGGIAVWCGSDFSDAEVTCGAGTEALPNGPLALPTTACAPLHPASGLVDGEGVGVPVASPSLFLFSPMSHCGKGETGRERFCPRPEPKGVRSVWPHMPPKFWALDFKWPIKQSSSPCLLPTSLNVQMPKIKPMTPKLSAAILAFAVALTLHLTDQINHESL
jgi:hypothetical protein